MKAKIIFGVFMLILTYASTSIAQFRFDTYTTDDGLPQNGVRAITQTPDGYLWFTTFDGLVRFDGLRFTVFGKNNSKYLPSNRFYLLKAEPDGTLFAGIENGGVAVYRDGIFKTFTTNDGLPSNSIAKIRTDIHGELVFESHDGNAYYRDGSIVPAPADAMPNNGLFYVGKTSGLWLYGDIGVKQITREGKTIDYPIKLNYFSKNYSGISMFEDLRGDVWMGDATGVHRMRNGELTTYTNSDGVPPNTILRPALEDGEGGLWFTSGWFGYVEKFGLVRFYNGEFSVYGTEAGLKDLTVRNIFKDNEGTIWAASDSGLAHLRRQMIKAYSVKDGLAFREVYPMLQTANGDIYAGTMQGLSRYRDGKFEDVATVRSVNYVSISALGEGSNGDIWVGDSVGLLKLENDRLRKIDAVHDISIAAITEDKNGNLWIGSDKGVFGIRDEKVFVHLTTANGLPSNDVKTIKQFRSGDLWIGTYGGVAMISGDVGVSPSVDRLSATITKYTENDGLAGDRVRTIYEDSDGMIWIGTYDSGISRFHDGKFANFTVAQGLFNDGAFQILEDKRRNFWISSNRGVYRVSRDELNAVADGTMPRVNSAAFGKADGMLSSECNGGRQNAGIAAADGKLWFPTQDGVIEIDPEAVTTNPIAPPVHIETVLVGREPVDLSKEVDLNANADTLEIRYTGISFIKPEQIKFRYRFEGLSDNFTDVGTVRELYFPSLPAGRYLFHVIAANADGVWNEDGATIAINVIAPFWRRGWFIATVAVLLLGLIFLGFYLRVRQADSRRRVQEDFSRRLLASQEQERQRIAAELHDSIGQSLLIIKNRAFMALSDLDERENVREQLEELSGSAASAIDECREISYNLRPISIERFGLTASIAAIFERIEELTGAVVSIEADSIDGIFSSENEINIYRIVQECVNNIIKHSEATAARLEISRSDHTVSMQIRDNGRGFGDSLTAENDPGGFGMLSIAQRIKMLGGTHTIESTSDEGTSISITIPLGDGG